MHAAAAVVCLNRGTEMANINWHHRTYNARNVQIGTVLHTSSEAHEASSAFSPIAMSATSFVGVLVPSGVLAPLFPFAADPFAFFFFFFFDADEVVGGGRVRISTPVSVILPVSQAHVKS